MSSLSYKTSYHRHLPHYQPPGSTLFITFRLSGSLPLEVIQRLQAEAGAETAEIERIADSSSRDEAAYLAHKQRFGRLDTELDAARHGPRWLSQPAIASLVCEALHYRDSREYTLEAYCVMPNHVHLVCTPLSLQGETIPLSRIMHSLKGYTARQANQILGCQGEFWQHESYDHVVRDEAELRRIVEYVLNNPLRAGLPAKWVYCRASC